jgi:predicted XRE-type DNA-binding protein
MSAAPSLKPLIWVGASRISLREFPQPAGHCTFFTPSRRNRKPGARRRAVISNWFSDGCARPNGSKRSGVMSKRGYGIGSRNVFQDIGVPNAEEHLVKAQLVFKIGAIMKKRRLKQVQAADLLGVRQPDVSKMLRGEFRQFSVERLLRFLVALNQDVEIVVKPHRGRDNAPALHVS